MNIADAIIAKKSLGQHFLKNSHVICEIVEAGEIKSDDNILEIGPGFGALTEKLAASPASKLYLCEKDRKLYEIIKERYASGRAKVICEDALTLIPSLQVQSPFKVISNLPYNISSPVIISLLTVCPTLPVRMVLMLQKEVAQRLVAPAGDSNRGWLTALLEIMAESKIVRYVSKYDFKPVPQVESAVLSITDIHRVDDFESRFAIRVLKAAFGRKRKKIKNSIFAYFQITPEKTADIVKECKINLDDRAEDLKKEQWIALIKTLHRDNLLQ